MSTAAAVHPSIGDDRDPHHRAPGCDIECLMLARRSARGAHHSAGIAERCAETASLAADNALAAAQAALAYAGWAARSDAAIRQSLWIAAALAYGIVVGCVLAVLGYLAVTTFDGDLTVPAVHTSITWSTHARRGHIPQRSPGHGIQSVNAATGEWI